MKITPLLLVAPVFGLLVCDAFAGTFPRPLGHVSDFANVIDAATEAAIEQQLVQLRRTTSAEIAVATIPALGALSVEEYASHLFKEWGIGQAQQDDGVLVLIAPRDRKMRIEVGYGLEGVLPDVLASQVIAEEFTPRFRDSDYSAGILNGVHRIVDVVRKHQVLTAQQLAKLQEDKEFRFPIWLLPFFGLFVVPGFGMLGVGLRTRTGFPTMWGGMFGGLPLLMSLGFMGRLSLMTLFPLAPLMALIGWRLGGRPSWRARFRPASSGGQDGGSSSDWTMGTSTSAGSGSDGSSGSSSDSFGGGGSSGGGGASGSW